MIPPLGLLLRHWQHEEVLMSTPGCEWDMVLRDIEMRNVS